MEKGRAEVQATGDTRIMLYSDGLKMPLELECARISENKYPANKCLWLMDGYNGWKPSEQLISSEVIIF